MDSGTFSTTIADTRICLLNAKDIALFSFIGEDSVFYLDLEVRTETRGSDYFGAFCIICIKLQRFTNFVNTEEKCRLFFAPRRRLLYNLNLDIPKGRERSLNGHDNPNSFKRRHCCRRPHIAKIIPCRDFYAYLLSDFINHAVIINIPKEKILKLITKLPFSELNLLSFTDISIGRRFIDCFYPTVRYPDLLSGFIKQFDVPEFMGEYELPEILKFLLYHARLFGNKILDDEPAFDLISYCISKKRYLNIGPLLNYISDSRPTDINCEGYLLQWRSERPRMTVSVFQRLTNLLREERLTHILLIIRIYLESNSEAASEALRLIWCSIPDACITYEELKIGLEPEFGEELMEIYRFYVRIVGECNEYAVPRPLQHLCRTVLRRRLRENKIWIPDGIRQSGLPKRLQSFLNLEKVEIPLFQE